LNSPEGTSSKPGLIGRFVLLVGGTLATLGLQLAPAVLGPTGVMLNLLIPLPAAFAILHAGAWVGIGIVFLTAGGICLLGTIGGAGLYLLQFGSVSLLLALLLRRGWRWDRAVAATLAGTVFLAAGTVGGLAVHQGASPGDLVNRYVAAEVDSLRQVYQEAQVPADRAAEIRDLVERTGEFLKQAWAGLAIAVTGALLLLQVLLLNALKSGRYEVPGPPFRNWKVPEPLVWILIAAGFGAFFGDGVIRQIALNCLAVLLPVYFLQGLAVVSYFFWKKKISPLLRTLGYFLIAVINPQLPMLLAGVGIFDLWIDFRKPKIKNA